MAKFSMPLAKQFPFKASLPSHRTLQARIEVLLKVLLQVVVVVIDASCAGKCRWSELRLVVINEFWAPSKVLCLLERLQTALLELV
jgi:hypothetical protein